MAVGQDAVGRQRHPRALAEAEVTSERDQLDGGSVNEIVVNGRTNVNAASENVMPPFGEVEDVVAYLDDIWAYLKARADGALGRGRPPRIGD